MWAGCLVLQIQPTEVGKVTHLVLPLENNATDILGKIQSWFFL